MRVERPAVVTSLQVSQQARGGGSTAGWPAQHPARRTAAGVIWSPPITNNAGGFAVVFQHRSQTLRSRPTIGQ